MDTARLGPSGVVISRVVLGCMFDARLDDAAVERIVHAAFDAGITSFDTAPLYGFGRSEQELGRALRDRRARVQVLGKAGLRWDDTHGHELFSFTDASGARRVVRKDSRPESLQREVQASLQRLGMEQIDLLQIHQPDADTKIADSIGVLVELVQSDTIRALGVSNYAPAQLREAIAAAGTTGVASLQSEMSLLERWPQHALLPLCREHHVGFLAFSPLAKGVLAGRDPRDATRRESRYADPLAQPALARALRVLRELAREHGVSEAQLALAWLLEQPDVSAVVAGASSEAQVHELAKAAELTLRDDEVVLLDKAFARVLPWLKIAARVRAVPIVGRAYRKLGR